MLLTHPPISALKLRGKSGASRPYIDVREYMGITYGTLRKDARSFWYVYSEDGRTHDAMLKDVRRGKLNLSKMSDAKYGLVDTGAWVERSSLDTTTGYGMLSVLENVESGDLQTESSDSDDSDSSDSESYWEDVRANREPYEE